MGDNSTTRQVASDAILTSVLVGAGATGVEYFSQRSIIKHPEKLTEFKEEADEFIKSNPEAVEKAANLKSAIENFKKGKLDFRTLKAKGLSAALIGVGLSLVASLLFSFGNKNKE
jgi:hypothetical protein